MLIRFLSLLNVLFLFVSCTKSDNRTELWVYTSSYKEVLAIYDQKLEQELPDIKVKWFQSGSENVASKIIAEMSAGGSKADLMMTSDLFFYQELKKQNALHTLPDTALSKMPSNLVDPDKAFVVSRFPVMVIAYNKDRMGTLPIPTSFLDLTKPEYKDKISMPSPMESGTALTTILFLKQKMGEEYFKNLRTNNIIAQGGNGATMAKIQSGEKPVGIVLLENVLQSQERGNSSVTFVIPSEGALPMPSGLAIFKNTKNAKAAKRLFEWFMGPSAQEVLLKGWNYSPFDNVAPPNGAPAWGSFKKAEWDLQLFEQWGLERQGVKEFFQKTVLQ